MNSKNDDARLARGVHALVRLRRGQGLPDWTVPRQLSAWDKQIVALFAFGSFSKSADVPGDGMAYSDMTIIKAPPRRTRGHAARVAAAMGDFFKRRGKRGLKP